jgi:hypothetical protein
MQRRRRAGGPQPGGRCGGHRQRDGAHAVIANVAQPLIDIGVTLPGQGWTYWNKGPGPGEEEYLSISEKDWTHQTGDAAANNLVAVARALRAHPIPRPPNA